MADELNTPNHRYYQNRYNVELAPNEMSKQWILASGIARIDNAAVLPLFASAELGVWYDPSDLTTLFQDNAGTTPVTAAGQTVGKMLDKSGRGNHATQATSAQRPTYGINPIVGTRNLLTYTEQFDNAAWTKANATVASGQVDPLGGSTAFNLTSTSADGNVSQNYTQLAATAYTFSIWVRRVSGTGIVQIRTSSDPLSFGSISVTSEWQRFSRTTTSNLAGAVSASLRVRTLGDVVQIWGAQLEASATVTAYQKVVSQYEVTQAGVQSVSYLAFDGVDDGMVTNTITPAIDKVQVFAGVRKLSDAAVGVIAEMSTSTFNNGAFLLQGPSSTLTTYLWRSCGTSNATLSFNVSAPTTNVITGIGNISGDFAALRVNGAQVVQDTTDQGTGNFLAYPLYIGRRGGTTMPFNGRLYSLITRFGANLTDSQIASTESWVNAKTGAY